jgi:hypothetical protein
MLPKSSKSMFRDNDCGDDEKMINGVEVLPVMSDEIVIVLGSINIDELEHVF